MAVIKDLYCPDCNEIMCDAVVDNTKGIEQTCPKCGKTMQTYFGNMRTMSFELKYNPKTDMCDWHGNRSRYWDDYNAKKAQGLKVRPVNED